MPRSLKVSVLACLVTLVGCAGIGDRPPLPVESSVDLERFMGDWYVIANIPTMLERGAHNAVENYWLDEDGSIVTTFTFRDGGFDGEEKRYQFRAFVRDEDSNAVWDMRIVWPFAADYRIAHVDDAYTETIIARDKRDYVWVMSREPTITEADYARLLARVADLGYDVAEVERVPQRW